MIAAPARAPGFSPASDPLTPVVVGVDHLAPIALRERVAAAAPALLERLAGRVGGAALLSTCNRTELYLVGAGEGLLAEIAEAAGLAGDEAEWLWVRRGDEAAAHLFGVAAGLESQLLGETEILRQVRAAHARAEAAGPVLGALFRHALAVGKRARARTDISRGAASVGSAAAAIVRAELPAADRRHAVLVGAGDAGRRVLVHVRTLGFARVDVVNRTVARAEQLLGLDDVERSAVDGSADRELSARTKARPEGTRLPDEGPVVRRSSASGRAFPLDALPTLLAEADVVLCATGSPDAVVTLGDAAAALRGRRGRRLLLLDLAVPRDVEPAVGDLPGVVLHDLDAVQARAAADVERRAAAAGHARELVRAEVEAFEGWLTARRAAPAIRQLRAAAEAHRRRRTAEAAGDLPEHKRAAAARRSRAEMRRLLHAPTLALRRGAEPDLAELRAAGLLPRSWQAGPLADAADASRGSIARHAPVVVEAGDAEAADDSGYPRSLPTDPPGAASVRSIPPADAASVRLLSRSDASCAAD